MKKILNDIQDGTFAKSWTGDTRQTARLFDEMIEALQKHPIEKGGKDMRKLSGLEK